MTFTEVDDTQICVTAKEMYHCCLQVNDAGERRQLVSVTQLERYLRLHSSDFSVLGREARVAGTDGVLIANATPEQRDELEWQQSRIVALQQELRVLQEDRRNFMQLALARHVQPDADRNTMRDRAIQLTRLRAEKAEREAKAAAEAAEAAEASNSTSAPQQSDSTSATQQSDSTSAPQQSSSTSEQSSSTCATATSSSSSSSREKTKAAALLRALTLVEARKKKKLEEQ